MMNWTKMKKSNGCRDGMLKRMLKHIKVEDVTDGTALTEMVVEYLDRVFQKTGGLQGRDLEAQLRGGKRMFSLPVTTLKLLSSI